MRSMFEYMGSMIVMIIISTLFISFISIEYQEIAARNYHSRVVEMIEYDNDYENAILDDYGEGIKMSLTDDNNVKVVYEYTIEAPIIGSIKAKEIVGYAR